MLYSHQGQKHNALLLSHSRVHCQLAPYTFVLVRDTAGSGTLPGPGASDGRQPPKLHRETLGFRLRFLRLSEKTLKKYMPEPTARIFRLPKH
jgi:hypothetical protein